MRTSVLTILMVCTVSIGHFVWAQEPTYVWGEPNTNDHLDREIDQLLTLGDQGFAVLRKKRDISTEEHYWIESYNTEFQLTGTEKVNFSVGVMGNSYDIEHIQAVNGTIYLFVSHWEKAAQKHSLSVHKLSADGSMEKVSDLDVIDAQKLMNRGQFEVSFSDDGSKLSVLSELPFVKKTNEKLRISCYEVSSMNKLWSNADELDWPSKRAYNNEIAVDNQGRVLLFKKIWQKPEWKYSLYTCDKDGLNEQSSLKLEGQEIIDYQIEFDPSNEAYVIATVSAKASSFEKRVYGYWFAHLNGEFEIETIRQENWGGDVLERLEGKATAKYLGNYHLKDILFRTDGDLLVLMEKMSMKKDGIPGSSPIQYAYEWNYGDFLTLCLSKEEGTINWWQSFKKKQQTKNNSSTDLYGSFVHFLKEDRLHILWNNTELSRPSIPPANWTEPDGTKYVKHKAFVDKTMHGTFMHVINADGSLAYDNRKFGLPLFNLHKGTVFEMSLSTHFSFSTDKMLVLLATMHNGGKRYRFGSIGL